jgi:hypothetical protein
MIEKEQGETMRTVLVLFGLAAVIAASQSRAQECLKPEWTHCEMFPNGGRVTGVAFDKSKLELEIPAASEICVINHEELGGDTFVWLARNGARWPDADWVANVDTFCLFRK